MPAARADSVRIDAKGAQKQNDDLAPIRAGESRIADAHWRALLRASGKAEAALLAALTRKSR